MTISKPRLPSPDQPTALQEGDGAAGQDGTALDSQLSHLSVSDQPASAAAAAASPPAAPAIPAIGDVDFFDHYADGAAPGGADVAAGSAPDASAGSVEAAGATDPATSAPPAVNGAVGGREGEEEEEEEDVSGDRSWEAGVQSALVVGNYEAAVEACIAAGRVADALLLAAVGGFNSDLWARTQRWYLNRSKRPFIQVGGTTLW